ncbi:hypothetical protein [Chromobacterium haemolyticum]|uniref:hypothetical protein n=1 Tax=Chromobacterium haemolyticum TaxID=394935 RepID=UPI0011312153|nr:hypothetical protein [Chromobacterium haemolyticum]
MGATAAGDRVTRSLGRVLSFTDFPCILLHQKRDIPVPGAPVGFEYRRLQVVVEVSAEGDPRGAVEVSPHEVCEPVRAQAHSLLHRTAAELGLSIESGAVDWDFDEENAELGLCQAEYWIDYRRQAGAL